jgi:hypothetical protein
MLTKIEEYNKNNIVHLPSLIQNPEEVDTEIVSDFVKSIHQKIELKVKKKLHKKIGRQMTLIIKNRELETSEFVRQERLQA